MPRPGATKVLHRTAKVDDLLDARVQPTGADATRPPILTDQAGRAVYFDIRMNQVAYEYVRAQGLFNGAVQQQTDAVSFPAGAILAKGAWRVLDEGQGDRFVTSRACVCRQGPDGQPLDCAPRLVGLVGLHLMAKTPSAPQWLWSTYEQVDNVPPTPGAPAAFNNPHCSPADCPPNQVQPLGVATQVTRVIPIPDQKPDCARPDEARDDLKTLNDDLARALRKAGSKLANYQLVGIQWPVNPAVPAQGPATVFQVRPALLGNTTLETFIQDTSSCMVSWPPDMKRRPEPELMADPAQALAYAQADFSESNRLFLKLLRDLDPGDLEGQQALDLGCGPGDIAIRFLKAWPGARCDALDGSAAMLACAQTALDALPGVARRCRLLQEVLPSPRLAGGTYDLVLSNSLLHHLHDPQVLWRAMRAAGRPGALVLVMDLMRPPSPGWAESLVVTYVGDEPETAPKRLPRLPLRRLRARGGPGPVGRGRPGELWKWRW